MTSPSDRRPASGPRLDPDAEYQRALSDDEVLELGYVGRDETGRWQKPSRVHKPTYERRARLLCTSCGIDPDEQDHLSWCPDSGRLVGAELRDCRDLQAAIAWQPERDLELNPELTPPEREQLARLFDALVARRREETPPRKWWTLKEWRSREGTA